MQKDTPQKDWIEIKRWRAMRDLRDARERNDIAMQQEAEKILVELREEELGLIPFR